MIKKPEIPIRPDKQTLKIKNIIFDLGGVLFDVDYNRTRHSFESLGIRNFDSLYSQAEATHLFQNLEKGTITPSEFYKDLNQATGLHLSEEEIDRAWNAMLIDFRQPSLDYLLSLRDKANLYLLSNTNIIHTRELSRIYHHGKRKIPFEQHFVKCVYSYETGTRKPDRACFIWTLEHLKIAPEETLFIDDTPQNITGAESVKIHSLLLEKNKNIEELGLEKWL